MNNNYEEVINKIQNTRRFGKDTGYEVSKRMLEQLGNPQSGIPFVHIAGTNGKGSTTAFLANILQQTGKKIGMFTSPHLVTFRERIRINGEYISEEAVTRLGNLLLHMDFALAPTMFDYCLAMAVLYFQEEKCDMMIIETGIGGRYDSTNALGTPEVALITKIGLDHTAVLGDTLEAIAEEKAGIIKPGAAVVIHPQQESVRKVLWDNYNKVNGKPSAIKGSSSKLWQEVTEKEMEYVSGIPMKMLNGYQIENAAAAYLAAKIILKKCNRTFEKSQEWMENCIHTGIANTFWKGRMEVINTQPFFMIDGAHNAHGVHALAESLKELYPGEKFHFIMGVMADKDYEDMIDELLPLAIDFITVTPESDRALQSSDLANCIAAKGINAVYAKDMKAVIRPLLPKAKSMEASTDDMMQKQKAKTVAFGSLYFIGAIEAMLEENNSV